MIVKMKKIWLLVSDRERKSALKVLRSLGVLHVQHGRLPQSEELDGLHADLDLVERAIRTVGEDQRGAAGKPAKVAVVEAILRVSDERSQALAKQAELTESAAWFERWGGISRDTVAALRNAGVYLKFYTADRNMIKDLDSADCIIHDTQHGVLVTLLGDSEEAALPLKGDPMPDYEWKALRSELKGLEKSIKAFDKKLAGYRRELPSILALRADLLKQIDFSGVYHGMEDQEAFGVLMGYVPAEDVGRIKDAADTKGWAYVIDDPEDPSEVPTLVRNPKWLKMIKPMFNFMGTLPGYSEFDISFWFLIFFSVFFAMIIGDAGYGLVFLALTLIGRLKMKSAPKEPFLLMGVLSATTIAWGLITGTWFGYEGFARLPFLNPFIVDQIYSYALDNQNFMMYLCFIIGIVHLSIAHGLRGLRVINSPAAIGELGWIGILWVLFFVAGNLVLNKPMPAFTGILFVAGVGLTLVFSNYQKHIFKGIMATLSDLPLSIISSFSDVVSYLRLFAVGYASVTVAVAFNNMAAELGFNSVLSGLIAALVLFMGHGLNIILGVMSVVVHGVRLNMLEFSGHLNMQWAGKPYQPFKE